MAAANADLVRTAHEALMRGDIGPATNAMSPDVTWRAWEPGPWDCKNRDQVLATLRSRIEEGLIVPVSEMVEVDATRVMIVMDARAIAPADRDALGLDPAQEEIANVVTLRDGLVVAMRDHRSRADAERAMGGGRPPAGWRATGVDP